MNLLLLNKVVTMTLTPKWVVGKDWPLTVWES